jgi:hypothetical protein
MPWKQGEYEDNDRVKDKRRPHGLLRLRCVVGHSKDAILSRHPVRFKLTILMPVFRISPFSSSKWRCGPGGLLSRLKASLLGSGLKVGAAVGFFF